ncbi:MAG: GNAT family N-acetyltransferase [Gemmatimonadetes bacterium]|nr:MAG: GNAT family N-acetyltransferase [Gemmatimonadota bacterium]
MPPVTTKNRYDRRSLDAIFAPRTVAVIGATDRENSVGRLLLWNLIRNPFGGTVFPVHPTRKSVLGIRAYPEVDAIPESIDLAVIAVRAERVPPVIDQCGANGVKGAIIISSGFRESGETGAQREAEVLRRARQNGIRVIGPNCIGLMRPHSRLNASITHQMAKPGSVAFISQSGAICNAILDWSLQENAGFSAFVSIGTMADINWGDLIGYFGDDHHTNSILLYMESIGDARLFLSAAREVALSKPIIVIKAGRTSDAGRLATAHTGAILASDEVLSAAFRRTGVLRVDSVEDLFALAEVLSKQPIPQGNRLAIITNAGGPAVLATDSLIREGGQLAEFSPETIEHLNRVLSPNWRQQNPVDMMNDATPEQYANTLIPLLNDDQVDGLLTIITPQATSDPAAIAQKLVQILPHSDKPVLTSTMGGREIHACKTMLNDAGIPTVPFPDTATRIFNYMWRYAYTLKGIYETPLPHNYDADHPPDEMKIRTIIENALTQDRCMLTEVESKQILNEYGIQTVETYLAQNETEAVRWANQIGFPVVLKLYSQTITHKADIGGVILGIPNEAEVRRAYRQIETTVTRQLGSGHFAGVTVQPMVRTCGIELIIGSDIDLQFGPALLFGLGGRLVEAYHDRAVGLPPLNSTLARRMMEQTQIYNILKKLPHGTKRAAELEGILVRFSQFVLDQPRIRAIDINPLQISPQGIVALDARMVLHPPQVQDDELPRPAIRPYPSHLMEHWTTKNGLDVLIRPIRPEDEPLLVDFHRTLSDESIYFRYFHPLGLEQRVAHERLSRLCFIDYDREMALVAVHENKIIGVGRLSKRTGTTEGEYAIIISDHAQRSGLGTHLLRKLVEIGRAEGLTRIVADILPENRGMQIVSKKVGFTLRHDFDEDVVKATIELI